MKAVTDFLDSKTIAVGDCKHEIKDTLWMKYITPKQCIKKQRHCLANKSPFSESYAFFSSNVRM